MTKKKNQKKKGEDAYNKVPEELKYCQKVNTFHDSLALDDFFFNQITNACKSCPMCLFMVLLRLHFLYLHSVIELVSLILPETAAVITCSQPRRSFSS